MSQLPNAPLIEVIFELEWPIDSKEDLERFQYIHGDLYARVRKNYPYRELLMPPFITPDNYIGRPSHRFRVAENEYPLIQIGPGLLTVNTNDDKYFWEEYKNWILDAVRNLEEDFVLPSEIMLRLQYHDFIEIDFEQTNIYDFLSQKLHITLNQTFFVTPHKPKDINLGFSYEIEIGKLSIKLQKAQNKITKQEGLIIQTIIEQEKNNSKLEEITIWLEKAYKLCSKTFKNMTAGELYSSFQKQ